MAFLLILIGTISFLLNIPSLDGVSLEGIDLASSKLWPISAVFTNFIEEFSLLTTVIRADHCLFLTTTLFWTTSKIYGFMLNKEETFDFQF